MKPKLSPSTVRQHHFFVLRLLMLLTSLVLLIGQAWSQLAPSGWPKEGGNSQNTGRSFGSGAVPSLRWFNSKFVGMPFIGPDGTVLLSNGNAPAGGFAAMEPTKGNILWSTAPPSPTQSWPALNQAGAIFGTGYSATGQSGTIYSINSSSGLLNWIAPLVSTDQNNRLSIGKDGSIYVVTYDPSNGSIPTLNAINQNNGTVRWSIPFRDSVVGSPAIGADGTIYVETDFLAVYALNPANGATLWKHTITDQPGGSPFIGDPVLGPDGTLYVSVCYGIVGGSVYALDSSSGAQIWTYPNAKLFSGVSLGPNNLAYIELQKANNEDNLPQLCALSTLDGSVVWMSPASLDFVSNLVIGSDGTVYCVDLPTQNSGAIEAYRGSDGTPLWTYSIPTEYFSDIVYDSLVMADDGALVYETTAGILCLDSIHIASFTVNPGGVMGGSSSTGTVTLSAPAPTGGAVITFTESSTVAGLPASVSVPAGQTSVTFPITTSAVSYKVSVQIQAFPGNAQIATLTVNPAPLSGLTLNPITVLGGGSSTGTVSLGSPAGPSGAVINLTCDNAAAKLPSAVTVAAGQTSATFTVTTTAVDSVTSAVVTATLGANSLTQTLTINPAGLASVVLNPTSVQGGASSTGTITLSGPAGPSGAVVALSSSSSSATLPGSVTIPVGQTSATFTVATTPVSAQVQVIITGNLNKVPQTATLTIIPATLVSLALNPTTVLGGSTSTGTVTLSGAAPSGGTAVSLSSANSAAVVPTSVTIAAGQTTATFTVTTTGVNIQTSAVITATLNNKPQTATLTITPAALFSISLSPASVEGGTPSTGTVTLSGPAGSGGTTIALSSNTPAATVPTSVTVPSGQTIASFKVTTLGVNAKTTSIISGTLNGTSQTANLTITPVGIQSFSLSPTTVFGGNASTGTIILNGPAGIGGSTVTLGSSNSSVTPPGSVTIAQGQTSASFQIQTSAVTSTIAATLTANLNGTTSSALLTVTAPVLQSLTISPSSLAGAGTATGTVTFSGVAPASGITVSLLSSSSSATVPSSVKVPAGQSSVSFSISAISVTASTAVTISATANFVSKSATLTLNPIQLMSLTLDPSTVNGGASSTGTVSLNGPAGKGGLVVHLKSSLLGVTIPATLPIAAGQSSATFKVTTVGVTTQKVATITATLGSVSETGTLTVNPPVLSGISLNPSSVTGSLPSTGTVTLSGVAPSTGMVVKLSSSSTNATVPVSVTIPSGKSSAAFTIKTLAVQSQTTATISGSLNGVTESATLTINPPSILTFLVLPASVKGGSTSTGRITLNAVAPKGGLVISLSAGQSDATVPTTLTIAAGRTTGTFAIKTGKVTAKTSATISASATGTTKVAVLTITP